MPSAKVRFINSRADLTVEFQAGTARATLEGRAIGTLLPVSPGPTLVTARLASGQTAQRMVDFVVDQTENITLTGSLSGSIEVVPLRSPPVSGSAAQITYYNATPVYPAVDIYAVPTGASVDASTPLISAAGLDAPATQTLPANTYDVVVTPAAKKTEIFRSAAVRFDAGAAALMLGAPRSAQVVTPQPILVAGADAHALEDSRPAIRLLRSSWNPGGVSLSVDGDPIVSISGSAFGEVVYHLSPGAHQLLRQSAFLPLSGFSISPDSSYVQTMTGLGTVLLGTHHIVGWDVPRQTADYPVPPGKARVRLEMRNQNCRVTDVFVSGSLLQSSVNDADWRFDVDPGTFALTTFLAGTSAPDGGVEFNVAAGHYYLVHTYVDPVAGKAGACRPGASFGRILEVNSDD